MTIRKPLTPAEQRYWNTIKPFTYYIYAIDRLVKMPEDIHLMWASEDEARSYMWGSSPYDRERMGKFTLKQAHNILQKYKQEKDGSRWTDHIWDTQGDLISTDCPRDTMLENAPTYDLALTYVGENWSKNIRKRRSNMSK